MTEISQRFERYREILEEWGKLEINIRQTHARAYQRAMKEERFQDAYMVWKEVECDN